MSRDATLFGIVMSIVLAIAALSIGIFERHSAEQTVETDDETLFERVDHIQEGWQRANALAKSILERTGKMQETQFEMKKNHDRMRWDLDDLMLSVNFRPIEAPELTSQPKNTVIVSKDYPKDRLPWGVIVDDKRPESKRGPILYMSVPVDDRLEERTYPSVVDENK